MASTSMLQMVMKKMKIVQIGLPYVQILQIGLPILSCRWMRTRSLHTMMAHRQR